MNYYIYGYTSKGSVRSENEDRILVGGKIKSEGSRYSTTGAPFIAAVCDGVGGEKAGELAAQTCLEELAAVHYRSTVDMRQVVLDIHRKVKKNGVIGQGTLNMQTTLCALCVDEAGEALCINVGDSRMYRYVNAAIRQLSTDQSYRQFIYEHGSDGEVSNIDPRYENAIVSSVGSLSNEPEVELVQLVTRFGKEPDDMILIVSDGISDYVSEQQLEIGMGLDLPIGQKLEAIAQLAVDNGSVDNISIVGIKPYITKQELEAITTEQKGETVNIQKLIAETDELGDILTFDINEILSKPYPAAQEQAEQETEKTKTEENSRPEAEPEPTAEPAAEAEQEIEAEPIIETVTEEEAEPETVSIPQTTEEEVMTDENSVTNDEIRKDRFVSQAGDFTVIKPADSEQPDEAEQENAEPEQTPVPENRDIPDELVETKTIADEFKVDFTRFKENVENSTPGEQTEQGGEKKQLDFSLHTVELMHQSASSLAKLENLFGKK